LKENKKMEGEWPNSRGYSIYLSTNILIDVLIVIDNQHLTTRIHDIAKFNFKLQTLDIIYKPLNYKC
jgi:hypothetical protein